MSDKKPKKPTKPKGKAAGRGGADRPPDRGAAGPSVATHPRAGVHVRRAKGWAGLAGFVIAGYLSLSAGAPPDVAGLRAIGAGICAYLVAWAFAVAVWRQLLLAELRVTAEKLDAAAGASAGGAGPDRPASPRVI